MTSWSVTSISHHFGSVAQSEEQPVVCGKAEGASPFGSANFQNAAVVEYMSIRLLNGTMQVGVLPAAPLPGDVKVARRFVKPHGAGASPALAMALPAELPPA